MTPMVQGAFAFSTEALTQRWSWGRVKSRRSGGTWQRRGPRARKLEPAETHKSFWGRDGRESFPLDRHGRRGERATCADSMLSDTTMAPVLPSFSFAAPALIATAGGAWWRAVDGTIERLKPAEAIARARGSLPLVCHAPAVAARLGVE